MNGNFALARWRAAFRVVPMNLPTLLIAAGALAAGALANGEEAAASNFEKDRQAILAMAGDFEVTFHFQETLPLNKDYKVIEKAYDEEANETVKVIEDNGKQIVLQHILQVGPMVVKHWAQIWTYEDTSLLEFQGQRVWETKSLSPEAIKGTWTQRVTEVTDEPRYEGYGKWIHREGGISEWTSSTTNRPLPRREYTKRSDYDLLVVTNRHTITPDGWYHEQDNVKEVRRDGKSYPLCREIGFNVYKRSTEVDFAKANDYWEKTAGLWKEVRKEWDAAIAANPKIDLPEKLEGKTLSNVVDPLVKRATKGETVSAEEIRTAMKPFLGATKKS